MPKNLGISANNTLAPCPDAPRCVSSDATDEDHFVEPFHLAAPPQQAWEAAVAAVGALPRSEIISNTEDYLHATVTSAVFRFVDDLELHLRPEKHIIAVRSASRIGYYDFKVNRNRVESLRKALQQRGVLK